MCFIMIHALFPQNMNRNIKNHICFSVKEPERQFLDLSIYPDLKAMGSFLGQELSSMQVWWKTLCSPADKPTNRQTNRHGRNITTLADVKRTLSRECEETAVKMLCQRHLCTVSQRCLMRLACLPASPGPSCIVLPLCTTGGDSPHRFSCEM